MAFNSNAQNKTIDSLKTILSNNLPIERFDRGRVWICISISLKLMAAT